MTPGTSFGGGQKSPRILKIPPGFSKSPPDFEK